jgi:hypothetical protein
MVQRHLTQAMSRRRRSHKMRREQDDVVSPLTQRRHLEDDLAQPVIKVGPKRPATDRGHQILVRRGDDPHVYTEGVRRSKRPDLAPLQEPQQHRLRRQRQVADLVQEQRPGVRCGEPAAPALQRPRERAALCPNSSLASSSVGSAAQS